MHTSPEQYQNAIKRYLLILVKFIHVAPILNRIRSAQISPWFTTSFQLSKDDTEID